MEEMIRKMIFGGVESGGLSFPAYFDIRKIIAKINKGSLNRLSVN